MYRLLFVYSDGTDDFDYWDEIETYDHEFETPLVLVETFIEMAKRHPQVIEYKIVDPQYKEPMKSIYHFVLENFKDQECYDLADRVYEVTKLDWEQYDKFFGESKMKDSEPCEVCKKAVSVDDLGVFELEWVFEVLRSKVDDYVLSKEGNKNIRSFIERLRKALLDKRNEEQDSKEYQEYLRLKEKFEGKQNG